ncbi:hypothetical protein XENTR_v10016261 [Xenopus tropicalis]|nr:hypothetical protein XENTR_v10016261 [Xenopus tropicalis]
MFPFSSGSLPGEYLLNLFFVSVALGSTSLTGSRYPLCTIIFVSIIYLVPSLLLFCDVSKLVNLSTAMPT